MFRSAFPVEDDILQAIEKMEQLSHKDTNEQPIIVSSACMRVFVNSIVISALIW